MNVLLTCAGRRNYMIDYFSKALSGQGKVFAADSSKDAPALQEADKAFIVPPVASADYFDTLIELCVKHQIKAVISLNDLELPLLARNAGRFLDIGTVPVVSNEEVINNCFDKWRMKEFLLGCGIAVPKTYISLDDTLKALNTGEINFPLVLKPRWGTASIAVEYPENLEELEWKYRLARAKVMKTFLAEISASEPTACILIQQKIDGAEYGLDVVNDLQGKHVCTFVKRKLVMRAGETERAVTVKDVRLEELGERLGESLSHVGVLDCDVMVSEEGCFVIDMNPRFGGGYPFSQNAGADIPAAIVSWINGERPDKSCFQITPNLMGSKCDRIVSVILQGHEG